MIGNGLSYVGVVVCDVPAVAEILERDFELPRASCEIGGSDRQAPVFPVGKPRWPFSSWETPSWAAQKRPGCTTWP